MTTENILNNLIDFCAPIVAIALIIFCVYQAFQIFRGSESASVKKLITGSLLLLFILGIIFATGSYSDWGGAFSDVIDNLFNSASDDAGAILGGGGGEAIPD